MATFPERALALVNSALVWLGDLALVPLIGLPPLAGLLIVSAITAAAMLPVIARTSDQKRMVETKRFIHAALFEIRLFNEDPRAVMRAFGDALRFNGRYLRLSLVPLLWMAIPLALLVTHLQSVYGYTGLEIGRPALVKVELRGATGDGASPVELDAPSGLRIETPAVSLSSSHEVLWRIVPTAVGEYMLTVRAGNSSGTKTVHVSDRPARRSTTRVSPGLVDQFLNPAERPLDDAGPIASIAVTYPEAAIDVLGWHLHWLIVYLLLSMACALILARRFGVTI